ncbi:LysM peptidoglycan-binding domain-containing protein [Methylacidiphilum caldifontis]|uniref:LysM peptidoglycan-binding domain-containing protein n=1 Tax=Methylacidiphilum caldifontis TaxID=2795386 RepID=UPI001A8F31B7|nr:LysM peptidoglycan-binding domain-containing protein [Methylacidiphilum caldifontis]QSR87917.1 LysM peptidoglycan-binding domain-containing protein [Methylacidiphilum caldifontis]
MALIIILFVSFSFFLSPSYALESGSSSAKSADTSSKKPTEIKYVVKKGDSLWKISRKYKVTVEALMAINELKDDRLKPGQELIIPPKGYRPPPKELLPPPSQEEKKDASKSAEPTPSQNP